jgi:hypothetical protein
MADIRRFRSPLMTPIRLLSRPEHNAVVKSAEAFVKKPAD